MIGSDFQPYEMPYSARCQPCGKLMKKGETVLASIREGKVRKRVCSEDCAKTFDLEFWEGVADYNETKRFLR